MSPLYNSRDSDFVENNTWTVTFCHLGVAALVVLAMPLAAQQVPMRGTERFRVQDSSSGF